MFADTDEAGRLAPIAEEILCQSLRVGKDWNGKRGAHFKIALLFRFQKKSILFYY